MSRCAARIALLAAGVALFGCKDLNLAASRAPFPYDYSIPLTNGLVFHWPQSALPVRIWVQNSGDLQHAMDNAIQEWESNAPYGEFRAIVVGDATHADVIVRSGTVHQASADYPDRACESSTSWAVNLIDSTLILPFRTTITAHTGFSPADVNRCFEILGVHELGHSVGIIGNSVNADDVMFGLPTTAHLSETDRTTFLELYHRASTVRLPPTRN